MTPGEAADLAARTLAAIDRSARFASGRPTPTLAADRERVASDLAGLRLCHEWAEGEYEGAAGYLTDLAPLFAAGLRRTAALYGVTDD